MTNSAINLYLARGAFPDGTGHQSYNCPEWHKAKASVPLHVSASSICFANLETLVSHTCKADVVLHLNTTHIDITNSRSESLTSDNDEFFSCHETFVNDDKTASITSFPSWSDAESWPDALDVECIIGPSTEGLDRLEGRPSMLYRLHPGEWPTWMHLEGTVQQLLVMFISAHDLQEALDAGVDPYKCFEFYAEGNCIEATDTICNHPDWRFPHQFSVTRNQLEDLGWGAPDIIQAEWNSWVNAPTLE